MVSFTRIFYPVCCNRQQINQNTANSSQRSKHHSILHQSCSRRHVGFRDMSTSGLSGIHFCHAAQKYCLKSTGLFFRILSKFNVINYHIISEHSSYSYTRIERLNVYDCLVYRWPESYCLSQQLEACSTAASTKSFFVQVLSPTQSLPTLFIRH